MQGWEIFFFFQGLFWYLWYHSWTIRNYQLKNPAIYLIESSSYLSSSCMTHAPDVPHPWKKGFGIKLLLHLNRNISLVNLTKFITFTKLQILITIAKYTTAYFIGICGGKWGPFCSPITLTIKFLSG